jgi:hypothetical protein
LQRYFYFFSVFQSDDFIYCITIYQVENASCKLYHQVLPVISRISQIKNKFCTFLLCKLLSNSSNKIHHQVTFASLQLLKLCKSSSIILFSCDKSKNLITFLEVFSKSKNNSAEKPFKSSVFFPILSRYSHIFKTLLKIIGQLNQKCVNNNGPLSL